jgi:hypothetical protein
VERPAWPVPSKKKEPAVPDPQAHEPGIPVLIMFQYLARHVRPLRLSPRKGQPCESPRFQAKGGVLSASL